MKQLRCRCGQRVYFENTRCLMCGSALGFDPATMAMRPADDFRACRNQIDFASCNWLLRADEPDQYCVSCRLNRTIPNLDTEQNLQRWRTLETGKRRLLYSLLSLRLPVKSKAHDWPYGLAFDFIEDQRSNPKVEEKFVVTGHTGGVITINIAEADDVYRMQMRQMMGELHRTVLGHFRHESGHYYYNLLVTDESAAAFRACFGDERLDYDQALHRYYSDGPDDDWRDGFISAYASAHPLEDWAETWAHYLLIRDALDAASAEGWVRRPNDLGDTLDLWSDTAIKINQVGRALGVEDPYPFVITRRVREKLRLIDQLLMESRSAAVL